jgi:uncharacterized repeat protein (TIGR01451 family)
MTRWLALRAAMASFLLRLPLCALLLAPCATLAQTVYGVGTSGVDRVWSVDPLTGRATSTGCALGAASNANGVSPVDGLVYYIVADTAANPALRKLDPLTCADTAVGNAATPGSVIRMTFCPDGRLYAATSNGTGGNLYIYRLSPADGSLQYRIILSGVPTLGSGDMACVNNGDMYLLANSAGGYRLYRVTAAALASVAAADTVLTATAASQLMGGSDVPNGLSEVPVVTTGCNANIATYPCLIASTGAANNTYGIDTQTGAAAVIGATGTSLTDLSRSFPVDAVVTKTRTSAATMMQQAGLTVTYTITVSNAGPGLVGGGATLTDTLDPAAFDVTGASWTCSVTAAGSATAVTTACGAASGTGSIAQTVNLSRGGVLSFQVTAPVRPSFNGVITNTAALTLLPNIADPDPSNNSATALVTVTPATVLSLTKSNGTDTLVAGGTTTYQLVVSNTGLADAHNTVLRDPAAAGLACTSVSCTGTSGGALCPAAPALTIAALQDTGAGGGIALPHLPAQSSVTLGVTCGVVASGL